MQLRTFKIAGIFLGFKLAELFLFILPLLLTILFAVYFPCEVGTTIMYVVISVFTMIITFFLNRDDGPFYFKLNPIKFLLCFVKYWARPVLIFIAIDLILYKIELLIFGTITFKSQTGAIQVMPHFLYTLLTALFISVCCLIYVALEGVITNNWELAKKTLDKWEKKNDISKTEN